MSSFRAEIIGGDIPTITLDEVTYALGIKVNDLDGSREIVAVPMTDIL